MIQQETNHFIYSFKGIKKNCVLPIPHFTLAIMWIGGYDNWTPAEREWDRDLEELEREQIEQKQKELKEMKACEAKSEKTWMDWAFEDPMFKATFTRVGESNAYIAELHEQTSCQLGNRNLIFEVVNPFYQGLDAILKPHLIPQTAQMRLETSSRQYVNVSYTCYCTPDTWSYTVMDEI